MQTKRSQVCPLVWATFNKLRGIASCHVYATGSSSLGKWSPGGIYAGSFEILAVVFRSRILDPVQEEQVLGPGGLRSEAHPALLALEALGRDFVVASLARFIRLLARLARSQTHDASDDDGSVDGNVSLEFVSRF